MNSDHSPSTFHGPRGLLIGLLAIAMVTFGVYWHGLGNALVFDDRRLTDGAVLDAYGALWPWRQRLLSYGSFVWLAELFGPENHAAQRVFNVVLHVATAAVVGLLAHALLTQWRLQQADAPALDALDEALEQRLSPEQLQARMQAALLIGVGWFALNPVAVYATGYLIQRSVVMAALFTALACWAWVRAWQPAGSGSGARTRWPWLLLAGVAAGLAFLSKEHAVLVPLLAVPLFIYVRRPALKQVAVVLGLALVVVALLAIVLWGRFGHLVGATAFDETSAAYVAQLNQLRAGAGDQAYWLSILNQARLFFLYLGYWLVPNVGAMSVDMRPVFPVTFASPGNWVGLVGFVALFAASAWALLARRDGWSLLGLCVLCVMVLFGTEFLTTWIQDPFVLYRSYLWAIFLPVGVVLVLMALPTKAIYVGGSLALLALAALSYERVDTFKTPYTAWDDAARKADLQAPPNAFGRWRPFLNRGAYYLEHSGDARAALADFDRAAALGEPLGSAQFSRGMALQLLERYPESVEAFHAAEKQGMEHPSMYYQAAVSLRAMGAPQNALVAIDEGMKRNPDALVREHLLLTRAETLTAMGQHAPAAQAYQQLLKEHPENGKYLVGLGMAHFALQDDDAARAQFDKALALREDSAAYLGRALLNARTGALDAARADVDKAVALDPKNPIYQQMKAQMDAQVGTQPPLGPVRTPSQ